MPVLKSPKHERFAQELAKGKTELQAYELAGYKPDDGNASKLASRLEIRARIQEITGAAAVRAEVTVASLIAEAEAARQLAMDIEAPAAAIAAVREKGVLSGKRIERSEHGRPREFEAMSADELRDSIARDLAELGREDLAASLVGGKGEAGRLPH